MVVAGEESAMCSALSRNFTHQRAYKSFACLPFATSRTKNLRPRSSGMCVAVAGRPLSVKMRDHLQVIVRGDSRHMHVCVCACVRASVRASVRVCVRACACTRARVDTFRLPPTINAQILATVAETVASRRRENASIAIPSLTSEAVTGSNHPRCMTLRSSPPSCAGRKYQATGNSKLPMITPVSANRLVHRTPGQWAAA